nr:hypothetical protein [Tanacetum cinerariifolium]
MNPNQAKSFIEEPEHLFSMGYEHFNTTLVTELDEVAESSIKNLIPIPHEYEVTSDNEIDYNEPVKDNSLVFTAFQIHFAMIAMILHQMIKMFQLKNPKLIILIKFLDHSFIFTLLRKNELGESILNTSVDNDSQREEIDIVTNTDDILPPGFENDDSEGELDAVDDLHVDNSNSNSENELSDNEASDFDNSSFPRPPPEPPDAEFDSEEEILVVMNDIVEFESLNPIDEFDVSNDENDDYFPFMFVIRIFLPDLIIPRCFLFYSPLRVRTLSLTPVSPFRAGEIPSSKIKVHIEVLSVLWGNRLPIRMVQCRCL